VTCDRRIELNSTVGSEQACLRSGEPDNLGFACAAREYHVMTENGA
jgi:hypothetical protein